MSPNINGMKNGLNGSGLALNELVVPHFSESDRSISTSMRHIPDDVFAQALDALVITCTDIVFYTEGHVLLARRNRNPRQGWWVIGGRMLAGESPVDAAQRCTLRETQLQIASDRFQWFGVYSTRFAQRTQPPTENGLHSVNLTFCVELTATEKSQIQLIDSEYDACQWLRLSEIPALLQPDNVMDQCLLKMLSDLQQQL